MPEIGAMQKDLGSAIAQLELIKKTLLEVFKWSSHVGVITKKERSDALLKIQIARSGFPVIDIALRDFLKQFNVNMGDRLAFEEDEE